MTAQILSLFPFSRPRTFDWSQQELSEFYRVEHALVQSGMQIETDRGVSDEGDPWFVFCRKEDGEVIVHFARFDGRYIVSSPSFSGIAAGNDFAQLVKDLISRHPLVHSGKRSSNSNVFLHPTALLIALVATAFFKSGEASAHEGDQSGSEGRESRNASGFGSGSLPSLGGSHKVTVALEASHVAIIVSAAIYAISSQDFASSPEADPTRYTTVLFDIDSAFSLNGDVKAALGPADQLDTADASQAMRMAHHDVMDLLAVVAVLSDVTSLNAITYAFDWNSGDPSPSHLPDEIAFHSLEESIPISNPGMTADSKGAIILELVKGHTEIPSIKTMETGGEKLQSVEILHALPQVLQPFLAESLHLAINQNSDGVLLALKIQPVDLQTSEASKSTDGLAPVEPVASAGETHTFAEPVSSPTSLTGLLTQSEKSIVVDLIEQFISHTPDYKVLVVDNNVIFYDLHAVNVGDTTLTAMTWDFVDGVSISLVAPSSNFHLESAVA